jgi:hypothetical protein
MLGGPDTPVSFVLGRVDRIDSIFSDLHICPDVGLGGRR